MENFSPGIFQGLLAGKGRSPLPTFSPFRTGKHWPGLSEVLQTAPTQKTGGRRTCFLRGIQKTRGRPPAGSIKGAALRIFTSITQRQQGLPRPVRRPLYKMENRRYNKKRNAPSFRLLMEAYSSVCRGRVFHHPFLHCTFLCAYNQIIPLFPRLSRQRDAASPARRGERRKPIAYFAGTV